MRLAEFNNANIRLSPYNCNRFANAPEGSDKKKASQNSRGEFMARTAEKRAAWHLSKCQDLVVEAYRIARRLREGNQFVKLSYRPGAIYGVPSLAIARELVKRPAFAGYSLGGMRMVLGHAHSISGLQEMALKILAGEGDEMAQRMLAVYGVNDLAKAG